MHNGVNGFNYGALPQRLTLLSTPNPNPDLYLKSITTV